MPKRHLVGIALPVVPTKVMRPEHVIAACRVDGSAELILKLLIDHVRHAVSFSEPLVRCPFNDGVQLGLRVVLFGAQAVLQGKPYKARRAPLAMRQRASLFDHVQHGVKY